jgi:protein-tyrosine phosphatase
MIDIHHHLLWSMDDGASSVETSVAMAKAAAADGISHIVCSPHANGTYAYEPQVIAEKIAELQRLLDRDRIAVKLGRGCDFHMSYENIQEAKLDPAKFSINGMGYLLAEIPDYGISPGLTEIFYQLQLAGLTPILTHPERNATLQADRLRMMDWLRGGVLVQVTAGSVVGRMGKQAERMAHDLLANRWVHFSRPTPTIRRRGHPRCVRPLMWWRGSMAQTTPIFCVSRTRWRPSWASRCSRSLSR